MSAQRTYPRIVLVDDEEFVHELVDAVLRESLRHYLFPLPADGAVYRCEAVINGRIIRARIEEREAARKLVEEKKAEGRRTALVESERDNLFTLSLGNIQPQDVVEVKLAYLQPLRRQGPQISLDLPLCPGVASACPNGAATRPVDR